MHAGRYGCRVQTTADSVSDEAELLVRGEYANSQTTDMITINYPMKGLQCMDGWGTSELGGSLSQSLSFLLNLFLPLR